MERSNKIVKIGFLGICINIVLAISKSIIGIITNSIAIMLDAVNNFSDALSSIVTIIGAKLSLKRPTKQHPFGYGRVEYFTSIIVAIIVLLAGLSAFKESFIKIFNPTTAKYSTFSLIIILITVFIKFFFGKYVKKEGNKLNSASLIASGIDSISDSVLSFSTFIGAIISMIYGISIEGYLGVLISIIIIKLAIEILKYTVDDMIGERADVKLTRKLKRAISSYEEVLGVYDLTIHNYGPNKIIASVHIQLDDSLDVKDVHRLTRRMELDIYNKYGITLTVGIYASNDSGKYRRIKTYIYELIKEYKSIIQIHGFYVDEEFSIISFDLVFSFDEENPEAIIKEIKSKLKEKYSQYDYSIIIDADISD